MSANTFATLARPVLAALALSAATLVPAQAQFGKAVAMENARFTTCQRLRSTGSLSWYAIATGTLVDNLAPSPYDRTFHTKACFTSRSACNNWIKRIWWQIPNLDELRNAYCKPV